MVRAGTHLKFEVGSATLLYWQPSLTLTAITVAALTGSATPAPAAAAVIGLTRARLTTCMCRHGGQRQKCRQHGGQRQIDAHACACTGGLSGGKSDQGTPPARAAVMQPSISLDISLDMQYNTCEAPHRQVLSALLSSKGTQRCGVTQAGASTQSPGHTALLTGRPAGSSGCQ